jgi:arabinogalactan oligomer / maltooligosaccharide transport system permease protein
MYFPEENFPGKKAILKVFILLYAFPSLLSMLALYKLLSPMGLINTKLGLIIVYTGTMAVFALWNMKGYFDTIPIDIEEAAMIDGTSSVQLVTKIILPLAKPTVVVTAMMVLIFVWNEYIFAINFMTGTDTYTLAAGLYSLQATEMSGNWPIFSAASIVVSIPILIVFFALQKNMTTGLTSGGVKG